MPSRNPTGLIWGLDGAEFNTAYGAPTHSYDTSFRVDHRFNDKYSIFGRFNYSASSNRSLDLADLAEADVFGSEIQTYTVGATQVFNSRWVNEIRGNYTRTVGFANATITTLGGAAPPSNSVLWPGGKIPAYGYSIFEIDNLGKRLSVHWFSLRPRNGKHLRISTSSGQLVVLARKASIQVRWGLPADPYGI